MSRIEISMKHRLVVLSLCYCCMNWSAMANAKNVVPTERKQQVISNVDTSLEGTQKYVLRVTGTPFYMTNIQLRLDLLRYSEEWSMDLCENLLRKWRQTDSIQCLFRYIGMRWSRKRTGSIGLSWTVI